MLEEEQANKILAEATFSGSNLPENWEPEPDSARKEQQLKQAQGNYTTSSKIDRMIEEDHRLQEEEWIERRASKGKAVMEENAEGESVVNRSEEVEMLNASSERFASSVEEQMVMLTVPEHSPLELDEDNLRKKLLERKKCRPVPRMTTRQSDRKKKTPAKFQDLDKEGDCKRKRLRAEEAMLTSGFISSQALPDGKGGGSRLRKAAN